MARPGGTPENLKKFEKGHPPCGGRPKGSKNLTTILRKLLTKKFDYKNSISGEDENKTVSEWINIALIAKAMEGNINAINTIFERIDGKVANELTADLSLNVHELSDEELNKYLEKL